MPHPPKPSDLPPPPDLAPNPDSELPEEEEEEEEGEFEEEIVEEEWEGETERRKQREFEVFVGGLPRDSTEWDVVKALRRVGDVVDVRLVRRPFQQKGFAFVRFAKVEQARRAAVELRCIEVRGNTCGIMRSNSNETLHIRNICTSWTKEDLEEKLKTLELENLDDVNLIQDPDNKGMNRGFAFIDFKTHMDAATAYHKLQQKSIFFGTDVRATFAFSRSFKPNEDVMAQVRSVFLDGLPTNWGEDEVRKHFTKFGEIENVHLACNMPTAKRHDFCFISFETRKAALDCINIINSGGLGDGHEKIYLKAALKRPEWRFPLNMGPRRGYFNRHLSENRECNMDKHPIRLAYYNRRTGSRDHVSKESQERPRDSSKYSSRHGYYRSLASPTMEHYGDQFRKGYAQRLPEDYERHFSREYAREGHRKYEIQPSRRYVREVREKYERQSMREYIREAPEDYKSQMCREYIREIPDEYGRLVGRKYVMEMPENCESLSRREYVMVIPKGHGSYPRREYIRGVPEKHKGHSRRDFVMEEPGQIVARNVYQDRYLESSSSRHALESYPDSPPFTIPQGQYFDDDEDGEDIYDMWSHQYYDREVDNFDLPSTAGVKRHYSELDGDLVESSSSASRRRPSRIVYEMDAYPDRQVANYVGHPRILPDAPADERVEQKSRKPGSKELRSRNHE